MLLPRLADTDRRHRVMPLAVVVVGAVGVLLTLVTAALGPHALPLVGGSAYGSELGAGAWLFAGLGTLLAVAQLLLYSGIASADRFATAAVWAAAGAECLAVTVLALTDRLSPLSIAVAATLTAGLLVAAGLLRLRVVRDAATVINSED